MRTETEKLFFSQKNEKEQKYRKIENIFSSCFSVVGNFGLFSLRRAVKNVGVEPSRDCRWIIATWVFNFSFITPNTVQFMDASIVHPLFVRMENILLFLFVSFKYKIYWRFERELSLGHCPCAHFRFISI